MGFRITIRSKRVAITSRVLDISLMRATRFWRRSKLLIKIKMEIKKTTSPPLSAAMVVTSSIARGIEMNGIRRFFSESKFHRLLWCKGVSIRDFCPPFILSFSKRGILELQSSRRLYIFNFWKVLLYIYPTSLYKGYIAPLNQNIFLNFNNSFQ